MDSRGGRKQVIDDFSSMNSNSKIMGFNRRNDSQSEERSANHSRVAFADQVSQESIETRRRNPSRSRSVEGMLKQSD